MTKLEKLREEFYEVSAKVKENIAKREALNYIQFKILWTNQETAKKEIKVYEDQLVAEYKVLADKENALLDKILHWKE